MGHLFALNIPHASGSQCQAWLEAQQSAQRSIVTPALPAEVNWWRKRGQVRLAMKLLTAAEVELSPDSTATHRQLLACFAPPAPTWLVEQVFPYASLVAYLRESVPLLDPPAWQVGKCADKTGGDVRRSAWIYKDMLQFLERCNNCTTTVELELEDEGR